MQRLNALFSSTQYCVPACSTISVVSNSATLWTADCQESLSMGFSKQEYWSGLPHPVPGDLSNRGIKPGSPVSSGSQVDSLPLSHWGSPNSVLNSVQFSRSVVSDFLRPLELQHARPPCPSPTPGVYSNSCPSSRWCHPTISSSVVPFSSAPNPSQHQGLFQWVNSLHEVAKVLEFQYYLILKRLTQALPTLPTSWEAHQY